MYKFVMHFLGLTDNRLNNLMYCVSPKLLSVIKMLVFISKDENSVGPDQLGSCSVLKKKDKSRLSMKVVNIHQLLCKYSPIYACTF